MATLTGGSGGGGGGGGGMDILLDQTASAQTGVMDLDLGGAEDVTVEAPPAKLLRFNSVTVSRISGYSGSYSLQMSTPGQGFIFFTPDVLPITEDVDDASGSLVSVNPLLSVRDPDATYDLDFRVEHFGGVSGETLVLDIEAGFHVYT